VQRLPDESAESRAHGRGPGQIAGLVALPVVALCLVAGVAVVLHQLLAFVVAYSGWLQTLAAGGVLALMLASPLLVLAMASGARRRDRAWSKARVRSVDQRVHEAIYTVESDIEGL